MRRTARPAVILTVHVEPGVELHAHAPDERFAGVVDFRRRVAVVGVGEEPVGVVEVVGGRVVLDQRGTRLAAARAHVRPTRQRVSLVSATANQQPAIA